VLNYIKRTLTKLGYEVNMKSSTIRRSNLSKEKIAVLEALSKYKNNIHGNSNLNNSSSNIEPQGDGTPEVYVRQNKEKELDLLWQNFKMPRGERSPIVYLGIGFGAGIIATLIVSAFIGLSTGEIQPKFNFKMPAISVPSGEKKAAKINFLPASNNETAQEVSEQPTSEEYTVQSGDTMESISRRFYGSYSPEKINKIMQANNMTDPNKLGIGQKLIIPMGNSPAEEVSIPTEE